jgi:nitroreductase
METWDALRARRNVRTFTDQAISQADIDRITEAGWRAPSASNTQPWDFIVCTDRELLTQLATLWQGAGHVANSAATIVLIAPDNAERRAIIEYDLGQATLQMMVAAADLGIGTAHASIGEKDRAREILGFPDDKYAAYFISMGYPADRPLKPIVKPNRRPIGEVVHHNHW